MIKKVDIIKCRVVPQPDVLKFNKSISAQAITTGLKLTNKYIEKIVPTYIEYIIDVNILRIEAFEDIAKGKDQQAVKAEFEKESAKLFKKRIDDKYNGGTMSGDISFNINAHGIINQNKVNEPHDYKENPNKMPILTQSQIKLFTEEVIALYESIEEVSYEIAHDSKLADIIDKTVKLSANLKKDKKNDGVFLSAVYNNNLGLPIIVISNIIRRCTLVAAALSKYADDNMTAYHENKSSSG